MHTADSDDLFSPSVDNIDDSDDEETINKEESLANEVHCITIHTLEYY